MVELNSPTNNLKQLRLTNHGWGKQRDDVISSAEKTFFELRFLTLINFELHTGSKTILPDHILLLAFQHDQIINKLSSGLFRQHVGYVITDVTAGKKIKEPFTTDELQAMKDVANLDEFTEKVNSLYYVIRDKQDTRYSEFSTLHARFLALKLKLYLSPDGYNSVGVSHDTAHFCNLNVVQDTVWNLKQTVTNDGFTEIYPQVLKFKLKDMIGVLKKKTQFEDVQKMIENVDPNILSDQLITHNDSLFSVPVSKQIKHVSESYVPYIGKDFQVPVYLVLWVVFNYKHNRTEWFEQIYDRLESVSYRDLFELTKARIEAEKAKDDIIVISDSDDE